ncbi:Uncharacterised protein [Actinomadura madurae]|nr:Uncharacterised protein [Actinomadura madurae]
MTSRGVILYGPPTSGKDTVTAELARQDDRYTALPKLKVGTGRSEGYRYLTATALEKLRATGRLVVETRRYGNVYAVDRDDIAALVETDRVPIVHMGNVADLRRLRAAVPLDWTSVLLWVPRAVCADRSKHRGDVDTPPAPPGMGRDTQRPPGHRHARLQPGDPHRPGRPHRDGPPHHRRRRGRRPPARDDSPRSRLARTARQGITSPRLPCRAAVKAMATRQGSQWPWPALGPTPLPPNATRHYFGPVPRRSGCKAPASTAPRIVRRPRPDSPPGPPSGTVRLPGRARRRHPPIQQRRNLRHRQVHARARREQFPGTGPVPPPAIPAHHSDAVSQTRRTREEHPQHGQGLGISAVDRPPVPP